MFVAVILSCCLFSACYEDKGNYDYRQMNDITIHIPLENNEYVMGDKLEITPNLEFAVGKESNELTYSWTFGGKEISIRRLVLESEVIGLRVLDYHLCRTATVHGDGIGASHGFH